MAYLILAYDHPGMHERREGLRQAHRHYLAAQGKRLLSSGALLDASGTKVIGGASLLDTDDHSEAASFEADDPYARAGLRARVEIVRRRLRWWMGAFNLEGHTPSDV